MEYNAALAKWNTLHVEEYEQTFQIGRCRYKMVVTIEHSTGNAVEGVKHIESLGATNPDCPRSYYNGVPVAADEIWTVGNIFYLVGAIVAHPAEATVNQFHGFRQYYRVEFDQTRGYPRYFAMSHDDYIDTEITIESLKVLRPSDQ